jgi:hypothetical protein
VVPELFQIYTIKLALRKADSSGAGYKPIEKEGK